MFNANSLGAPFQEIDAPVFHHRTHREEASNSGTHNNNDSNSLKIFSDPIIASVIPTTPIQQSIVTSVSSNVLSEITFQTPPTRRVIVEPAFLFGSPTVDSAAADIVTDFVEIPNTPKPLGSLFQTSPFFHTSIQTSPLVSTMLAAVPTTITANEPIGTKSVPPKPPIGLFQTFPKLDFESLANRKIFTSATTTTTASVTFLTSPVPSSRVPAVSPMTATRKRKYELPALSFIGRKRRQVAVTNENSRPKTPIKPVPAEAPVVTAAVTPTAPEKKPFKCFSMDYCSEAHSKSAASRRRRHKNLFPELPTKNRLSLTVNPLTGKAEIMQEPSTASENESTTTAGITFLKEDLRKQNEKVVEAHRLREIEEEEETEKEDNDQIEDNHFIRVDCLGDSDIFEEEEEELLNEIVNTTGLLFMSGRINSLPALPSSVVAQPTTTDLQKQENKIEPPLVRIKALIARRKAAAAAAASASEAASIAATVSSPASFPAALIPPVVSLQRSKSRSRTTRASGSRSGIDTTGLRPNTYMSTPTTTPKKQRPAVPLVHPSTPVPNSVRRKNSNTTAATAPAGRSVFNINMVSTPTLVTKHYTPKCNTHKTPASVHPTPPTSVTKPARTPGNYHSHKLVLQQPWTGAAKHDAPAMDAMFPSLATSSDKSIKVEKKKARKASASLVSPSASEPETEDFDDAETGSLGLSDARSALKIALLREGSSSFLVDDDSIYL